MYISACCLLLLQFVGPASTDKIIFTQILYRHGDRAPYYSYPLNPVTPDFWWQGLKQLTTLGMQQQYELGTYLKNRYINGHPYMLLNSSYKPTEIYVRSTDVDRTLMSAYSNLAGLYPPEGSQVWNKDIKWQPIPVHTIPEPTDNLLNMDASCREAENIYENFLQTAAVQTLEQDYEDFYSYLKINTGLTHMEISVIWQLYDTLLCQLSHGVPLPAWASANWDGSGWSVFKTMELLYGYQLRMQFDADGGLRRLRGGPLLKNMINFMTSKINGSILPADRKMVLYAAHDITVAGLLCTMNVYNGVAPPYASAVMVELIKQDCGGYIVQVLYKNDTTRQPYPLLMPGCLSSYCTFDEFVRLTANVIPGDWTTECNTVSSKKQNEDSDLALLLENLRERNEEDTIYELYRKLSARHQKLTKENYS